MPSTFYVRTADKKDYIQAKFLTDIHGIPIVSSNQVQSSFNLFDADHNPIGTNIDGYLIVPANFDIKTAVDFGRSVAFWRNAPGAGDVAGAAKFVNAFYPGQGWLDIQTHYNGTTGQNVPAFRDAASYIYGVAGRAAELPLETLKWAESSASLFTRKIPAAKILKLYVQFPAPLIPSRSMSANLIWAMWRRAAELHKKS